MPTVDSLDIQISTSLKNSDKMLDNLITKLGAVSSSLSGIGKTSSTASNGMTKLSNSATKSTKSFKGLASAIGSFYANYAYLLRGIKSLYKSIEGTADYIEAFNYFEVTFNKISNDWKQDFSKFGYDSAEAYAESFGKRAKESLSKLSGVQVSVGADGKGLLTETGMKNLGLNIRDITQYASQLASVTNSVGQTGEVSLRTSNAFTKLAGDISSLFNQDYNAVAKNLQSGLIGQSRALYKYGIDITNATLQTYAYELGLEKAVSEMTQAEKMQLRMIAILDQSKVSWGDLANTINSPSNMLRQFKNNLKEAGMVLGQLFVPLLQKVLPIVNGATIAIKRLLTNIAGFLGIKLDLSEFGQGGLELDESFDGVSDSLDDVAESANKAKAGLRGFDELKTIQTPKSSSDGLGNTIDLTNDIIKATEEYEKVWQEAYDKMEQRAQKFADAIEKAFAPVEKLFKDIKVGDWFAVGQDVSDIVSGIFDFFSRAIESVDWYKLGINIGLFLEGINWTDVLSSVGRFIWNAINAAIKTYKGMFDAAPIETTIITAIALLSWTGLGSAILKGIGKSIIISLGGSEGGGIVSIFATFFKRLLADPGLIITLIGTPAFDIFVADFGSRLLDAFDKAFPKLSETLSYGLLGAVAGAWIPAVGPLAGFIVGTLVGALENIEIDGASLFDIIFGPLFNFDYSLSIFEMAGKFFKNVSKAWEEQDWLSVGWNIIKGIGLGIYGALYFLEEPIIDLFYFIYDTICDIFGINSPAKEMEPLGKNIFLGIVEGFGDSFEEMRKKIQQFFKNLKQWWENNKPTLSGIKLNIKTPKISVAWDTKSATAQVLQKLGLKGLPDFSVQWFKTGGYLPNSFSLIGAGENGVPEIMGSVGGRPAIAGGAEITGIRDEIRATANEEILLLKQQNALLQAILNKEFGITDSDIGKSAQRYARDYFNRTGNEAYSF